MRSLTSGVRRCAKAFAATLALGALLAPVAAAEVGTVPAADTPPVKCNGFDQDQVAGKLFVFCVELQLLEGQTKFGKLESTVDDAVSLRQAFGVNPDLSIDSLDEEGGGAPSLPSVDVPGGLLGTLGLYQEGLKELIDALEPINGINASIGFVGESTQTAPDLIAFLTGNGSLTTATMPVQVKVNNPVLGETCFIGNADNPIELNLPIQLSGGYQLAGGGAGPGPLAPQAALTTQYARLDTTDNAFAIPAAEDCGIAGTGALLNDAGLGQLNVFDKTVNDSVGLPSASGNNLLDFDGWLGLRACNPAAAADIEGSCLRQD